MTARPGPAGSTAEAYSRTGGDWQAGPGAIYDRLAEALIDRCPGGVAGRTVLDVGAGTGAAGRAARRAGAAAVVALDAAAGMLYYDRAERPPAVVGDAARLPFADRAFGAVVAAFSLNHLGDPAAGLAEAARVAAPGGVLAASAYALDDTHPVKAAVEAACTAKGWTPEPWYEEVRSIAIPRLASMEAARSAASDAGLDGAMVEPLRVPFPELRSAELVAWRLGMAQVATFLAALDPVARRDLEADALDRLGQDPPVLVRSCIIVTWSRT